MQNPVALLASLAMLSSGACTGSLQSPSDDGPSTSSDATTVSETGSADVGPNDAPQGDAAAAAVDAAAAADAAASDAPVSKDIKVPPDTKVQPDTAVPVHLKQQDHSQTLLFNPSTDQLNISYHSFRIPAITRTKAGTLLAFAEGRACSSADYGNINMVYKRSTDHGKSWGALREVVGAGQGTWGNPTPVSDMDTGTVWLFMSYNAEDISQNGGTNPCTGQPTSVVGPGDRPVYLSKSTDDGKTWSKPVNMTATLQPAGKAWDAVGPGIGIQTTIAHKGRLIIPATNRNIYSDDHGKTWKMKSIPSKTGEGAIVELSDGSLMRNDRAVGSVWTTAKRRWVSYGTIENSFSAFAPHNKLLCPRCQGSTVRYSSDVNRILFLNPASTSERCKMRVRISYDDGKTWPISRRIHDNMTEAETCTQLRGGYSSMIKTADYHVGALIERGGTHRSIEFHRFNLPWILDGTPEP